ncbi:MAG: hypothetical protein SVK08_00820 [Halobacteriota archaeon]|nr:hypothetical protein [Halobacteriota archaeon]
MPLPLFSEENLIIPLCASATAVTSNTEMDSFHMKGYDHATIVIIPSSSLTGDNVLTVECGASDSADTSDATFHYRLASAAIGSANADVLATDATAATLTLTAATYQNKMLVLEIDASELPSSGNTIYDWITVDFDGTASAGTVAAVAILSRARKAEAVMDTALA